jgi:hypothetical protein
MSAHNSLVATYANHHLAEIDIEKMQNAGIDMSKLRIVSHNPYRVAEQRGLAPVLGSFGELDAGLYDCIPERDIVDFEAALGTGRMFIVAHAAADEIDRAKLIARSTHNTSWDGLADCEIYYGCMD